MPTLLNRLADHPLFATITPGREIARDPLGFVDIGAQGGVHDLVSPLARHTAVLAFEPDPTEHARLATAMEKDTSWAEFVLSDAALAGSIGPTTLHCLTVSTNNSLRPPNMRMVDRYSMVKWHVTGSIPVQATTLDALLFDPAFAADKRPIRWGEFLKIDTQGTEYEILEAGARVLGERTVAVFTEVSFYELYAGQYLFADIDSMLRAHGFQFYGFGLMHTRSTKRIDKRVAQGRERPFQADAIFLKDPLPLAAGTVMDDRQAITLFLTSVLLGYADFALELASKTFADGAEYSRVEQLIGDLCRHPPSESAEAARQLAEAVAARPEDANVLVGQFVDGRRLQPDYKEFIVPQMPPSSRGKG